MYCLVDTSFSLYQSMHKDSCIEKIFPSVWPSAACEVFLFLRHATGKHPVGKSEFYLGTWGEKSLAAGSIVII